jgi:hypothetical protein
MERKSWHHEARVVLAVLQLISPARGYLDTQFVCGIQLNDWIPFCSDLLFCDYLDREMTDD